MARILVSMSDDFLNKIDRIADVEQRTRSELVREALRSYMKKVNVQTSKKSIRNAEILDEIL